MTDSGNNKIHQIDDSGNNKTHLMANSGHNKAHIMADSGNNKVHMMADSVYNKTHLMADPGNNKTHLMTDSGNNETHLMANSGNYETHLKELVSACWISPSSSAPLPSSSPFSWPGLFPVPWLASAQPSEWPWAPLLWRSWRERILHCRLFSWSATSPSLFAVPKAWPVITRRRWLGLDHKYITILDFKSNKHHCHSPSFKLLVF